MAQNNNNDYTKERILNEAEILFAQKGFHAVTVREITNAAHCNLAAVNYHFRNKENLYLEVFRARWVPRAKRLQEFFRKSLAGQDDPSPSAIVQALAGAFLEGPLSDEERQRHFQLMTTEMAKPGKAFELVAEKVMRPFFKELAHMLRSVVPERADEERLMLNIMSIFAMVLHFNFARAAISHITGREYDPAFKALLVEHIMNFSLTGLGGGQEEKSR